MSDTGRPSRSFLDLPLELQQAILEQLEYHDLKAMSRASQATQSIVDYPNKRIRAALFRSEYSWPACLAHREAWAARVRKTRGPAVKMHPLADLQSAELHLWSTRENLKVTFGGKLCSLDELKDELEEGLTEPPCNGVSFQLFDKNLMYSLQALHRQSSKYWYDVERWPQQVSIRMPASTVAEFWRRTFQTLDYFRGTLMYRQVAKEVKDFKFGGFSNVSMDKDGYVKINRNRGWGT